MVSFLVGISENGKKGYFYVQIDLGLQNREDRTSKISPAVLFSALIGH